MVGYVLVSCWLLFMCGSFDSLWPQGDRVVSCCSVLFLFLYSGGLCLVVVWLCSVRFCSVYLGYVGSVGFFLGSVISSCCLFFDFSYVLVVI